MSLNVSDETVDLQLAPTIRVSFELQVSIIIFIRIRLIDAINQSIDPNDNKCRKSTKD